MGFHEHIVFSMSIIEFGECLSSIISMVPNHRLHQCFEQRGIFGAAFPAVSSSSFAPGLSATSCVRCAHGHQSLPQKQGRGPGCSPRLSTPTDASLLGSRSA